MAREHDWTGSVHNLEIEVDQVSYGHAYAESGSSNIFAAEWETYSTTEDNSPNGILSVILPSFFTQQYNKIPSGATWMRLNFYTSPTPNCITYTLTNAQAAFFGVPTLYIDATAGPSIYNYAYGWRVNPYSGGYDVMPIYASRVETRDITPTAFLLVDSNVANTIGLNPRKGVDLSKLMQEIAQACIDAGDTPGVFYTSNEYSGNQFRTDMASWIGHETWDNVYTNMQYIENNYTWEEVTGVSYFTQYNILFSKVLSYIVNNFETESLVPNYYNYSYMHPETWNYDFTISEESGRVTVYATKAYGGIHFSNVQEMQQFFIGNTTLGVQLTASHKFLLRNTEHNVPTVIGELAEDGEDAKTYRYAFQLYEIIANTDDYLNYLANPEGYVTKYLQNNFCVESSVKLHVYGITNYSTIEWTYASGFHGEHATPITYNYAIPIKYTSDHASENILSNRSGLTPAFVAYSSEIESLSEIILQQMAAILTQTDVKLFQGLIDVCNAILDGDMSTSTWLIENATFNYIESTKNPEEYWPEDDTTDNTPDPTPPDPPIPPDPPTPDPSDRRKKKSDKDPKPVPSDTGSMNTPNLGNMYQFDNITDLNNFTTSLWGPNVDWDNLLALFDNPLDGIYSLMAFPCDFPHGSDNPTIYCGNVAVVKDANTPYSCERVTTKYTTIEFPFDVGGRYHSFLDFSPYTQVQLHVPYYGLVDLPLEKVMYHNCKLIYYIDANTGTARAQIKVYYDYDDAGTTRTGRYIVWESDVQIGVELPISGSNWNRKLASTLCNLGEVVINPVAGAIGTLQSATAPNTISKNGSYMSNTSILADRTVYLIYNQPQWLDIAQYNHTIGRKCNLNYKLGDLVGFTKTFDVDVSGIPATSEELDMIKSYLDNGVIL